MKSQKIKRGAARFKLRSPVIFDFKTMVTANETRAGHLIRLLQQFHNALRLLICLGEHRSA